MNDLDTIVALSTPPGRGALGVIRLSGPYSLSFAISLLRDTKFSFEPNRVIFKTIYDPDSSEPLDQCLVTYFKAPHSFTGEDVVEFSCHGSPVLLLNVLDTLLRLGARTAGPGEFTMRAVSNGKLNLSQAEALRDIIEAQTNGALRQAARQLDGELSRRLQPIKDVLIQIIVHLESSLEFVEDDLPQLGYNKICHQLGDLTNELDDLTKTFRLGSALRNGLRVTLVGRPNVGKSSLFNKLLSYDRAIVTHIPGTTRDSITETMIINDVPVVLTDTAGIHQSSDLVEVIGIEKTRQALADADLVVIVCDGTQPLTKEDRDIFFEVSSANYLMVLNKSDLESFSVSNISNDNFLVKMLPVSAKTGDGLDKLRSSIIALYTSKDIDANSLLITNARHFDLLRRSGIAIHSSIDLVDQHANEDLILIGLYDTLHFLGEITGETTTEDVLSSIFSTFCIGK